MMHPKAMGQLPAQGQEAEQSLLRPGLNLELQGQQEARPHSLCPQVQTGLSQLLCVPAFVPPVLIDLLCSPVYLLGGRRSHLIHGITCPQFK